MHFHVPFASYKASTDMHKYLCYKNKEQGGYLHCKQFHLLRLSCRINNYYLVTRLLNQSTAALGPVDQNETVNILKLQLPLLQQTLLLKQYYSGPPGT